MFLQLNAAAALLPCLVDLPACVAVLVHGDACQQASGALCGWACLPACLPPCSIDCNAAPSQSLGRCLRWSSCPFVGCCRCLHRSICPADSFLPCSMLYSAAPIYPACAGVAQAHIPAVCMLRFACVRSGVVRVVGGVKSKKLVCF
jgi:hypothetical protein